MMKRCFLLTIWCHLILLNCCIEKTFAKNPPRLLIISLDGFGQEYLKKYSLPTINRIQNEGIKTKNGMQPTFVTMTYPNHISIATGMYQEDHGIIHNTFFDTKLNKTITFGTRDEGQWNDSRVEPIWITATKQNKKSAVLYWPASHNEFHGYRPLFYTSVYSDFIPLREKINNAISYFKQTDIQLIMLYHYEPDKEGHDYGPDSNETRDALVRADNELNYLLTKVKNELNDDLNIIVLSDHGMANTKRFVRPFLDGYLNRSMVEENILSGSLFSVTPRSGQFQQVFDNLTGIPDVTVYKREQLPKEYHYSNATSRLGEIIVLPNYDDIYFSQTTNASAVPPKGSHGYDNNLPSMQAIFMAQGPDFNQHMEIDSLKNVDVYHIACRILSLKPNPYATAGSLNNLTGIFRNTCSQLLINIPAVLFFLFLNFIMRK